MPTTQSTKLNFARDVNGFNSFAVKQPEDKYSAVLVQSVAQNVTVPDNNNNWIAVFSYTPGASVWISINGTANAPAGAVASTDSELNPAAIWVLADDVISFITEDSSSPEIGIKLYVTDTSGNPI